MKVSVVIPTYKRNQLLKRCLESVAKQKFSSDEYEIIVADDAADAATKNLVSDFALNYIFLKFKYVALTSSHGPAAARNAGWRQAQADIVAFIDDDCIAEPGWLSAGLEAFTSTVAAVSGKLKVPIPEKPKDYELCIAWMENCRFLTANCFYRKSVLSEIGGFDEKFKAAWREDSDLYFTVLTRNLPVRFAKKAIVVHPVRKMRWGRSLKEEKKNVYNALLFKKHPLLFRKFIEPSPPWLYYLIVSCAIAGSIGTFFSSFYKAFIFLWVVLSLLFAAKRIRPASKSLSHILELIFTSFLIPFLSVFWRIAGAFRFGAVYF